MMIVILIIISVQDKIVTLSLKMIHLESLIQIKKKIPDNNLKLKIYDKMKRDGYFNYDEGLKIICS